MNNLKKVSGNLTEKAIKSQYQVWCDMVKYELSVTSCELLVTS